MAMATVTPDTQLPEKERENLKTIFDILTKNGWRFNKYDKKWLFKFKKTGFETYKDRYIFIKLLKKYGGQLDGVLNNMSDNDKRKLEQAGFPILLAEAKGKKTVKIDWEEYYKKLHEGQPWMKDKPFDESFAQTYNQFTLFPKDPNEVFQRDVLPYDALIIEEFGEIPPSVKPAYYNYRKAVYDFIVAEARARAIAPPWIVVGASKYKGNVEKANKIMEKALKNIEKARNKLERAISFERARRRREEVESTTTLKISELKGSKLKKDLDVERVRQIYHNKHKDGSGNFGILIVHDGAWYRIDGDYYRSGVVSSLRFGRYGEAGKPLLVNSYDELIVELRRGLGLNPQQTTNERKSESNKKKGKRGWWGERQRHSEAAKKGWLKRYANLPRYTKEQLLKIQAERGRGGKLDRKKRAKKVLKPDDPRVAYWVRNPGKYDVEGVDTP